MDKTCLIIRMLVLALARYRRIMEVLYDVITLQKNIFIPQFFMLLRINIYILKTTARKREVGPILHPSVQSARPPDPIPHGRSDPVPQHIRVAPLARALRVTAAAPSGAHWPLRDGAALGRHRPRSGTWPPPPKLLELLRPPRPAPPRPRPAPAMSSALY
jgi:hypothetical protein